MARAAIVQLKDLPHVSDVREHAELRRRGGLAGFAAGDPGLARAPALQTRAGVGPGSGAPLAGGIGASAGRVPQPPSTLLPTQAARFGAAVEALTTRGGDSCWRPVVGGAPALAQAVQAAPSPAFAVLPLLEPLTALTDPEEPPEVPGTPSSDDSAPPVRYPNTPPLDVCVVRTVEEARLVAAQLMSIQSDEDRVFACDTEVADIDVASQSPCCHGTVTCLSIYAGPGHRFGSTPPAAATDGGRSAPAPSIVWVDTLLDGTAATAAEARAIFDAFVPFLTSPDHLKVWHNYGFDRHVLQRVPSLAAAGMCRGFGGDTMHMARLWDAARAGRGYSLESLTGDVALMGANALPKRGMRSEFARPKALKNGGESKVLELPAVRDLQIGEETRWRWVRYSAIDARATWDLYRALKARLSATSDVEVDPAVAAALATDPWREGETRPHHLTANAPRPPIRTMWDVYTRFWRPFGELLTKMEDSGMPVDREHLAGSQARAEEDRRRFQAEFRGWASERVPGAALMNVGSGAQVLQLLFAGARCRGERVPTSRTFKVPNPDASLPVKEGEKKPKKFVDVTLHGLWGEGVSSPLVPDAFTPAGQPQCNTAVLIGLAGKPGGARKALDALPPGPCEADEPRTVAALRKLGTAKGYGGLFPHFGTEREGLSACAALGALVEAGSVETLLSSFIVPLQSDDISRPEGRDPAAAASPSPDAAAAAAAAAAGGGDPPSRTVAAEKHRVHCSMNINTETGRLSARCPNLQNQPALEKDRYKVRKAFATAPGSGRTLVVADYGQLELRVLAHVSRCKSMIEAFEAGGDFHSRTALGMYPEIQRAVEAGEAVLEWDGPGPPPAPLIKDKYSAERRRAKVLNFSIAYGKTEHGLSRDWGVTLEEAKATVNLWYESRPEVREWQRLRREEASTKGYVTTILGRRRPLPDARGAAGNAAKAHALRAAINSPIQGSAADIATAAMLRISRDEVLKELGWRLLLQIHDEVILEGPKETAPRARERVIECMRRPFSASPDAPDLLVDLVVDSKIADSWFEAK